MSPFKESLSTHLKCFSGRIHSSIGAHQGRWARPPCRMGEGGEQCRYRLHQSGLPRRWVPLHIGHIQVLLMQGSHMQQLCKSPELSSMKSLTVAQEACTTQQGAPGQMGSPSLPQGGGGGAVQIPPSSIRSPSQMGASANTALLGFDHVQVQVQGHSLKTCAVVRRRRCTTAHKRQIPHSFVDGRSSKSHQGRWARPPCRMGEGGEQCRCRPHQSGLPRRWVPLQTQRCLIT